MTIQGRKKHLIDINNPTWNGGTKTDSWTNDVRAFVNESSKIVVTQKGSFVRANFLAVVEPDITVDYKSKIRFNGSVYPVIALSKVRRSMSDQIKHIEIYA